MKETTLRPLNFAFYDRGAIQAHLEKMAAQGWLVDKPGNCLWRYRRIQPTNLHFSVTYFPNASDFDPGPTDGQQQMVEYCARDGWVLVARWGQMQIFYNEGECPAPIETDAVTQVGTIHRAILRNMIPTHFVLFALCVFQFIFCFWRMMDRPTEFLSTPSSLYMLLAWLLLLLSTLFELLSYFHWHHRAKAAAESGYFLEVKTNRAASTLLLIVSATMIILAISTPVFGGWPLLLWPAAVVLVALAVNAMKKQMKHKGISRRVNRGVSVAVCVALTLVAMTGMTVFLLRYGLSDGRTPVGTYERYGRTIRVYDEYLPLRIEDFTSDFDAVAWSLEQQKDETALLSRIEYTQWPLTEDQGVPNLTYTITDIKVPFLYGLSKTGLLNARKDEVIDGVVVLRDSYEPTDAAPWGAAEAYQLYWSSGYINQYLLCYETRIVEIDLTWEPTPEQMGLIGEKLSKG